MPFDEQQLAERRKSIGASEAFDIVQGRLHKLWLRKTNRQPPEPDSDDAIYGRIMETGVLDHYEDTYPERSELRRQVRLVMPGHPLVTATPDGLTQHFGLGSRVVEVKCPRYSRGWGPAGSQVIPPRVWWQVQQQLACSETEAADVAALLHREVRIYRDIPAHAGAQRLLVAEIEHFWATYVVPDREPPPDDSEQCAAHLARLYPHASDDRDVQRDDDAATAQAARDYIRARDAAEAAEADKRRAKAVLTARIGNAYGIEGVWGSAVSANVAGRKRVDHAALCLDLLRAAGENPTTADTRLADLEKRHTTTGAGHRRLDVTLKEIP